MLHYDRIKGSKNHLASEYQTDTGGKLLRWQNVSQIQELFSDNLPYHHTIYGMRGSQVDSPIKKLFWPMAM